MNGTTLAGGAGAYLAYMNVAIMTSVEPITNSSERWKSKKYMDAMHDITIAADVAKPSDINQQTRKHIRNV